MQKKRTDDSDVIITFLSDFVQKFMNPHKMPPFSAFSDSSARLAIMPFGKNLAYKLKCFALQP
jgi:hypothetical protein